MKWLWKVLAWIADFVASIFREKSAETSSDEDSKKIDKADDGVKDVTPDQGKDDDVFDNNSWNDRHRPSR